MFSTKCETFALLVAYAFVAERGTIFKAVEHSARQKN